MSNPVELSTAAWVKSFSREGGRTLVWRGEKDLIPSVDWGHPGVGL